MEKQIYSSYLLKQGAINTGWKKRWFVLTEGTLTYYKDQKDIFSKKGKELGTIFLDKYQITRDSSRPFAFRLNHPEKRTFFLAALSEQVFLEWVAILGRSGVGTRGWDASKIKGLKEGFLYKRGGIQTNWKRRYFLLRYNVLFYFANKEDVKEMKLLGAIDLFSCQASSIPESQFEREFTFQLFHPQKRTYFLQAPSERVMGEWIRAVSECGIPRSGLADEFRAKGGWAEERNYKRQYKKIWLELKENVFLCSEAQSSTTAEWALDLLDYHVNLPEEEIVDGRYPLVLEHPQNPWITLYFGSEEERDMWIPPLVANIQIYKTFVESNETAAPRMSLSRGGIRMSLKEGEEERKGEGEEDKQRTSSVGEREEEKEKESEEKKRSWSTSQVTPIITTTTKNSPTVARTITPPPPIRTAFPPASSSSPSSSSSSSSSQLSASPHTRLSLSPPPSFSPPTRLSLSPPTILSDGERGEEEERRRGRDRVMSYKGGRGGGGGGGREGAGAGEGGEEVRREESGGILTRSRTVGSGVGKWKEKGEGEQEQEDEVVGGGGGGGEGGWGGGWGWGGGIPSPRKEGERGEGGPRKHSVVGSLKKAMKKADLQAMFAEPTSKIGYLQKTDPRKNWQMRLFVLKRSYLAYFETPDDTQPLGVLHLHECTVGNSYEKKYCFALNKPGRTFWLATESEEEKEEWMSCLQECIEEATKNVENPGKEKPINISTISNNSGNISANVSSREQKSSKSRLEQRRALGESHIFPSLNGRRKEGFLSKKGQNIQNWKIRWFVLQDGRLEYYKNAQDPKPLGVLLLQPGTTVMPGGNAKPMGFQVVTPTRVLFLQAKSRNDRERWEKAITEEINQS